MQLAERILIWYISENGEMAKFNENISQGVCQPGVQKKGILEVYRYRELKKNGSGIDLDLSFFTQTATNISYLKGVMSRGFCYFRSILC